MKKLAVTLCLTALATAAFAQGTINVANTAGTLFRTNSTATGGTSGNTANGGGYLYHVLTAPSSVTSVDSSLQALLTAPWSDTGMTMTNGTLASGGRVNGPSGAGGQVANWPGGAGQSFIVVGWSVNEGASWSALMANLAGAHFNSAGYWDQGALLVNGGFIGASTVQAANSGAPDGTGAFSIFGASAGAQGTPITTPTALFVVNTAPVPEPASMALAGLGIGALMIFRRRKA